MQDASIILFSMIFGGVLSVFFVGILVFAVTKADSVVKEYKYNKRRSRFKVIK